jgi:hypothetical protein
LNPLKVSIFGGQTTILRFLFILYLYSMHKL